MVEVMRGNPRLPVTELGAAIHLWYVVVSRCTIVAYFYCYSVKCVFLSIVKVTC